MAGVPLPRCDARHDGGPVARLLPRYHYVCTRHRYWIGPPDVGQQGVEPRDAGTAGALNNVSQQLGPALGVALISTFVATATNHYLTHHGSTAVVGATVHGFTVGYWWAAGVFWAGAVICSALIRGGHPTPPRGRPTRAPRRDRQRTDLTQHVVGGAPTPIRIAAPPTKTRTTRSIADSIPPEALMRFGFIRPGNMAQAIASQLQPVASELVPALREAAAAERGRSRTGERP
ncbi:MAG: hypothetical protein ACLPUO_00940 [Streptosporangiaceae bacterium]